MSILVAAGAALSVGLFGYLWFALLFPETLS
jgi:K+-transporting ATPase KdpF subunit